MQLVNFSTRDTESSPKAVRVLELPWAGTELQVAGEMLTLPVSTPLAAMILVLASVAAAVGKTAQASDVGGARLLAIPFGNSSAARVCPLLNTSDGEESPPGF